MARAGGPAPLPGPATPYAREDWERRIGIRSDAPPQPAGPRLPPPDSLRATPGRGCVTLSWSPVPGASGYLVHRGESEDGPWTPLDHGGGDVLAVPGTVYGDTLVEPGRETWYSVATVTTVEAAAGDVSAGVSAMPLGHGEGQVRVRVDALNPVGTLHRPWRPIIGSEHLALLRRGPNEHGFDVGKELSEALRLAHDELGAQRVRAHGALLDELGVYREVDGRPVHDFAQLDAVYDHLLALGLRPVVELSFMPRDLAADPSATVFDYRAIISPPRDWERWGALVGDLARHLVERYGIDEVVRWGFEVWNEPNLVVFWAGSQADYLRLYDVTARAIKAVDERLPVGGPSSAAAGWVDDLLRHADASGAAVDFISTHTYGSPPLDLRPIAEGHGRAGLPIWWTEWGVSPTHFAIVNDGVFGAPLVAAGMKVASARREALAYWVASDHFVELGEPPRLFHGGFGLLSVGNLRKPRWWVLAMLERLGDDELSCRVEGDGAGALVDAWAARDGDGRIAVAIWNGTLDQYQATGSPLLGRSVELGIAGLDDRSYELRHHRIDAEHSNILAAWERLGRPDWPNEAAWRELRAANSLDALHGPRRVVADGGEVRLTFELPMPAASLVELEPAP